MQSNLVVQVIYLEINKNFRAYVIKIVSIEIQIDEDGIMLKVYF
jgi:hypothetical protein